MFIVDTGIFIIKKYNVGNLKRKNMYTMINNKTSKYNNNSIPQLYVINN